MIRRNRLRSAQGILNNDQIVFNNERIEIRQKIVKSYDLALELSIGCGKLKPQCIFNSIHRISGNR